MDFIAEVSSNHNNDIERSKKFIDVAKAAGCTGIKFQLFKINEMFSHEILAKSPKHQRRKKWELSESYIPILSKYAHDNGMLFSCTPFYLNAVDILEPYVDFFKIASYELLWLDLFKKCCKTNKPLVFSTGMATIDEVLNTLSFVINNNCKDITILHCNSAYPTPVNDTNLNGIRILETAIKRLSKPDDVNIKLGYSDHTVVPGVIYRAVNKFNLDFLEFHLDLDGKGEEHEAGHCWMPNQIASVIKNISTGFEADGRHSFEPSESEIADRDWRADPIDGLRPLKKIRRDFK
jgi:sialic acid synthase SpsE